MIRTNAFHITPQQPERLFQPVNNALMQYRQGMDRKTGRDDQIQQQGVQNALARKSMAMREKEFAANQDHRQQSMGMRRQEFSATQQMRNEKLRSMRVQKAAGLAQMARGNAELWQQFSQADPNLFSNIPEELRGDPVAGADYIIAEARGYVEPTSTADAKHARAKELLQMRLDSLSERGGKNRYGLNPIYGRDESGNVVVLQTATDGTATQTAIPEGVTVDPGLAPQEAARGRAIGKGQGESRIDLPKVEREAVSLVGQIDALLEDPYLPSMTGADAYRSNITPRAQGVQARMDQVRGKAFMQAFQALKGAGQITELEGAKAEAALTRLGNPYQSDDEYKAALEEFKREVLTILETAKSRAGVATGGERTFKVLR